MIGWTLADWYTALDAADKCLILGAAILAIVASCWKWVRWAHKRVRTRAATILAEAVKGSTSELIDQKLKPMQDMMEVIYRQISQNGFKADKPTLLDKVGRLDETLHELLSVQRSNRENSPQPLFECGPDGPCTWVNSALANLFGVSVASMTDGDGKGWLEPIETPVETFEAWHRAVVSKCAYSHDYVVRNKVTGERTLCNAIAKPFYAKDGRTVIRWNGSVNPIKRLP